jgi:hypothetical protein
MYLRAYPLSALTDIKLQQAKVVVNTYGHVLASLGTSTIAHPTSLLSHNIDEIKSSINILLNEVSEMDSNITHSLAQSYVFLGQFVSDEEAQIVVRGQAVLESSDLNPDELLYAEQSKNIISKVKLEMEALLLDIQSYLK